MELEPVRPRLRGVLHQWAFAAFGGGCLALVITADTGRARVAALIYALSVVGLFGTSALYHRRTWSDRGRRRMKRLDHSMIFVLIAGTYTPFAMLVLEGRTAATILIIVWGGAVLGIASKLIFLGAPKWVSAPPYLALGWVAVAFMPQLEDGAGVATVVLIAAGGGLYSLGAIVYATGRPNPFPAVFGYHEVFHVLTIVAATLHFIAVGAFALNTGA
ncbi:MAG TPA: hemolysin III family protein [Mycobacteriales bacterium]|nr:hemolysin III family protein [Mycobacteriales bacterium]